MNSRRCSCRILGSPLPHLHRDQARPCHICTVPHGAGNSSEEADGTPHCGANASALCSVVNGARRDGVRRQRVQQLGRRHLPLGRPLLRIGPAVISDRAGRYFGLGRPLLRIGPAVISDRAGRYFGSGRPLFRTGPAVTSDRAGRYFGSGRPLFRIGPAVISDRAGRYFGLGCSTDTTVRLQAGILGALHKVRYVCAAALAALTADLRCRPAAAAYRLALRAGVLAAALPGYSWCSGTLRAGAWAGGPRRAVETTSSATARRASAGLPAHAVERGSRRRGADSTRRVGVDEPMIASAAQRYLYVCVTCADRSNGCSDSSSLPSGNGASCNGRTQSNPVANAHSTDSNPIGCAARNALTGLSLHSSADRPLRDRPERQ
jgi:hypothetical protein